MGKRVEDANTYRIGHPLAQRIIDKCKAVVTEPGEVVFRYMDSGKKIAVVEPLVGQSGWLLCSRLTISAFETEDHLLFAGVTDAGASLDPSQAGRLFDLPGEVVGNATAPNGVNATLAEQITPSSKPSPKSFLVRMERGSISRWTSLTAGPRIGESP